MTDIAWLVALHCPRAVSPHPNFASTDYVSAPGMLGLVIQGRGHEVHDFLNRSNGTVSAVERRLIDAAKGLFDGELRASAVHELTSLVRQDSSDPSIAATAALLATLGLTEMDAFADAFRVLNEALDRLTDSPDDRLFEGSLRQQLAMRLAESGIDDATARVDARSVLEAVDIKDISRFRTSKGAKWGPATTLRNIRALLLEANRDLEERRLGFPDEKTLQSLLRRDHSAITSLVIRDGQGGETAFVSENFDRFALSDQRTFRSSDPVDEPLWRALTQLELAGYYRQALRHRRILGQLRLMRAAGRSDAPQDGLRLIRQSGDLKVLNLALNHMRGAGPLEILHTETRDVLVRRLEPHLLRDVELAVLTFGAQTLGEQDARQALDAVLNAVSTPQARPVVGFQLPVVRLEQLVKAAVALAPVANANGRLSDWLIAQVRSIGSTDDELLVRALTRALSAVSWDELEVDRKLSWREWLSSRNDSDGWSAFSDHLEPLIRSVSRDDDALQPERLTPGRIATELNAVMAGKPSLPRFLDLAVPEVRAMLERKRSEARRGQFGFGSVDAADIAAGLCIYLGADLWEPLVDYLTDPLLPQNFKSSAMDRLATGHGQIPRSAAERLSSRADRLLEGPGPLPFDAPSIEPFPAAIRLLGAIGAQSSAQLVVSVAKLASGDERSRLEASRTVTTLVQTRQEVADWLVFAAMQLSADTSANVRAESGRSLALAIGRVEVASELMASRLQELLDEDGILVPLLVLRGLAGDIKDMPATVLDQVQQIAETHMVHGVREQARYLLDRRRS